MNLRNNIIATVVLIALVVASCTREQRRLREPPPSAARINAVTMGSITPGERIATAPTPNMYEENAYALSEGERLYNSYNCVGCHAHGGGSIGPALMDDQWIYGSDPANVFATIVEGRPNGMPSYRGRIPDYQVWELVAYVRSLGGLVQYDVQSARSEHMYSTDQTHPATTPKPGAISGSAKQ
jgi:cytochrome c oxidase cbb3-type subunit 3